MVQHHIHRETVEWIRSNIDADVIQVKPSVITLVNFETIEDEEQLSRFQGLDALMNYRCPSTRYRILQSELFSTRIIPVIFMDLVKLELDVYPPKAYALQSKDKKGRN